VEATVHALLQLEPVTRGLPELLHAFDRIIDRQIDFLKPGFNTRHPKRVRPREQRKFPRALLGAIENLVVVYGESVPTGRGTSKQALHWVAERVCDKARFDCVLEPPASLSPDALRKYARHMLLTDADLASAISPTEFVQRWASFLRRNDLLVAYNHSTTALLRASGVTPPRSVALKATYFNLGRYGGSLDQIVQHEGLSPEPGALRGRGGQRLANALSLLWFLRERLARGAELPISATAGPKTEVAHAEPTRAEP
jgi:hypothetical protein